MITIETSKPRPLPKFTAYEAGLYRFTFVGDLTYTDDLAVVWTWEDIETSPPLIYGIRYQSLPLTPVDSIAECKALDNSFYYDLDDNGTLYVHWDNTVGDWSLDRTNLSADGQGIASSDIFDAQTGNYIDGIAFRPDLVSISGLSFKADPFKLGLLAENTTSVQLDNTSGAYDIFSPTDASGSLATIKRDGTEIFTGFTADASFSEEDLNISLVERRFFQNTKVCQNNFNLTDYPYLDDNDLGKPIPVLLGKVFRAPVIPIKAVQGGVSIQPSDLDKAQSQTITFKVCESLSALTTLFNNLGTAETIASSTLSTGTFTWTRPANSELDFNKFTVQAIGPSLVGNNGVGMMRWALVNLGQVASIDSQLDTAAWDAVEAANTQDCGLYIASDIGITEGIIQPICASLQVFVFSKGNGVFTIRQRDPGSAIVATFDDDTLLTQSTISYNTSNFTSTVLIGYAYDFALKTYRESLNTSKKAQVELAYGQIQAGSMFKTALYNKADAEALATELVPLATEPQKLISWQAVSSLELLPFDTVQLNLDRLGNYKVELLEITQDITSLNKTLKGRVIG